MLEKRSPTRAKIMAIQVAFSLAVILAAGCGQRTIYPVRGQIVDRNGNPVVGLKGGSVEFETIDQPSSASGAIDENGKFQLSTLTPGDGAHVGKNRVLIMRRGGSPDTPAPQVVHRKYESQKATDLFVTVEPRSNDIKLEVDLHQP